jgi:hypothetical protein
VPSLSAQARWDNELSADVHQKKMMLGVDCSPIPRIRSSAQHPAPHSAAATPAAIRSNLPIVRNHQTSGNPLSSHSGAFGREGRAVSGRLPAHSDLRRVSAALVV